MSNLNNNNIANRFGDLITQSLQAYQEIIESGLRSTNLKFNNSEDCDTCPPKQSCPPKFIGKLYRKAMSNESIIIPFIIKNSCSVTKIYKVGIRELVDINGNLAISQPVLSKKTVTLAPNGQERILIGINLANFNKSIYSTEVVVRELEYNQNILLTLDIDDYLSPILSPIDENKYKLKWQNWKTHFYCEPKKRTDHGN